MSYHIDEQIEDRVVPALKEFLKSNMEFEAFSTCIRAWFNGSGYDDRLKKLILDAMFSFEDQRNGRTINQIFNVIHENMELKELHYQDGSDLIVEKFNAITDEC